MLALKHLPPLFLLQPMEIRLILASLNGVCNLQDSVFVLLLFKPPPFRPKSHRRSHHRTRRHTLRRRKPNRHRQLNAPEPIFSFH